MKKRIISIVLALTMVLSIIPWIAMPVRAASTLTLAELRSKYPDGKYWNHADNPGASNAVNNPGGVTSTPCSKHGGYIGTSEQTCNGFTAGSNRQLSWQCMGYAEQLGYLATGYNPRENANGWYTYTSASALNNLKPGDIVRYNSHSIYVINVDGDTVTYTDCNSDGHCIIQWDATISKSTLKAAFVHLRSAPSGVNPGDQTCDCSTSYAGLYICTTVADPLMIRSGHGTSYSVIGSIPPGATVTVTKASGTGNDDWAHVEYNGISGYASMMYLAKMEDTQERNTRIQLWVSDSEMGDVNGTVRTGEWLYLCYKIFDLNTGDYYDTYATLTYTAKLTWYGPDGSEEYSETYTNDNNWIAIKRSTPGEYTGELVVTFENGSVSNFSLVGEIIYDPEVTPSASNVQLNVSGTNSQTIWLSYSGASYSNAVYLECVSVTGDCFTYEWGSWTDHQMPLTIIGTRAGQGVITIGLYDADTDALLATTDIYVTVLAPTYTVSYNANGGTGAPESQSQDYGSALMLSDKVPTRSGYTFLGWSTNADATYASYQPGEWFYTNTDVVLYAVWQKGCGSDHDYVANVVEPTCIEWGYTVYICSNCGDSYVDDYVEAPGHAGVVIESVDPTCTEEGYTKHTCSKCGYSYNADFVAAMGHSYVDTVVPPTLESEGYTVHTCQLCGYSYQDDFVDKLVPYGDVNGDGRVDGRDLLKLKRYLTYYDDDTGTSTETVSAGADVNGDGRVDGRDLLKLKRYLTYYDDDTGTSTETLGPQN